MHTLGPYGSLQRTLLRGWEFLLLPPQPPWVFEALFPHAGALGCAVCFAPPPFLPVYVCANVGMWGLLAAAWPASFHNLPCLWVRPPCLESSLLWLPVSTPPTSLDECFFFISLIVRLPCSSIFCQFWLFFVFKLSLSFFWLCEEAQCVYLRLHLGWKPCLGPTYLIFIPFPLPFSSLISLIPLQSCNHHTAVHIHEPCFVFDQSLHPFPLP